jgi:hypothetical protein
MKYFIPSYMNHFKKYCGIEAGTSFPEKTNLYAFVYSFPFEKAFPALFPICQYSACE